MFSLANRRRQCAILIAPASDQKGTSCRRNPTMKENTRPKPKHQSLTPIIQTNNKTGEHKRTINKRQHTPLCGTGSEHRDNKQAKARVPSKVRQTAKYTSQNPKHHRVRVRKLPHTKGHSWVRQQRQINEIQHSNPNIKLFHQLQHKSAATLSETSSTKQNRKHKNWQKQQPGVRGGRTTERKSQKPKGRGANELTTQNRICRQHADGKQNSTKQTNNFARRSNYAIN